MLTERDTTDPESIIRSTLRRGTVSEEIRVSGTERPERTETEITEKRRKGRRKNPETAVAAAGRTGETTEE